MDRRLIEYPDGKDDEINIYGEATRSGEKCYLIGASKSQLGRKDVDRFNKLQSKMEDGTARRAEFF